MIWAGRAEEQPEKASPFLLMTDGDFIWQVGVLKNGLFRAGKFEAKTLRKAASVRMAFDPITTPAAYVGFQALAGPDPDVHVSMVQPAATTSIFVAIFSESARNGGVSRYNAPDCIADFQLHRSIRDPEGYLQTFLSTLDKDRYIVQLNDFPPSFDEFSHHLKGMVGKKRSGESCS